MLNQELSDYIEKTRKSGFTDKQIRQALYDKGWQETDIYQAFGLALPELDVEDFSGLTGSGYSENYKPLNEIFEKRVIIASILFLIFLFGAIVFAGFYFYKYKVAGSNTKKTTESKKDSKKKKDSKSTTSTTTTTTTTTTTSTTIPTTPSKPKTPSPSSPSPSAPTAPSQPNWSTAWYKPTPAEHGTSFRFSYPSGFQVQRTNMASPSDSVDSIDQNSDNIAQLSTMGSQSYDEYLSHPLFSDAGPLTYSDFRTNSGLTGKLITADGNIFGNSVKYYVVHLHSGRTSDLGHEITIRFYGIYAFSGGAGHGTYTGSSDILDQIAKTISL